MVEPGFEWRQPGTNVCSSCVMSFLILGVRVKSRSTEGWGKAGFEISEWLVIDFTPLFSRI